MNEKKDIAMIPYIAHEGEMARSERVIRRLIKAIIVLAIILLLTNALWIYVTLHDMLRPADSEKASCDKAEVCEVGHV